MRDASNPHRHAALRVSGILVALCLCAAFLIRSTLYYERVNAAEMQKAVTREVRPGASRTEVEKWLIRRNIDFGWVHQDPKDYPQFFMQYSRYKQADLSGYIDGYIANNSRKLLDGYDLHIIVLFDRKGRFLEGLVYEFGNSHF